MATIAEHIAATSVLVGEVSWMTDDPWPTVYPGA